MNETVDSVYRFVTDQSSSAYNKMNSLVASLRRRFDKVLTASTSNNSSPTPLSITRDGELLLLNETIADARLALTLLDTCEENEDNLKKCLHATEQSLSSYSPATMRRLTDELRSFILSLSHSDQEYYSPKPTSPTKTMNVYDTLSKHRPIVRSNPAVNNAETGKPVDMQRHSLRSSMRNLMKRRPIKQNHKQILGSPEEPSSPHIYESLDSPSPDASPSTGAVASSNKLPSQSSTIKSSYIIPTSLVVLDHFTTNLYLVVNATVNQLLVVFGSTKIHTLKLYDTDGRKISSSDLILQYKFEDLHGYKLLSSALNSNLQNRLVVNEIRVYVTPSVDDPHGPPTSQTLKQRLIFFDETGRFISTSKRVPVSNELLFVEVDRLTTAIYAYDGIQLICLDRGWSTNVENMDSIACGSSFLVCLHAKSNQLSIYNSQTGAFIYRWLITAPNIRHLQAVSVCVSRNDAIYVLAWNRDAHPFNNLVLIFDEEGQLRREYFIPNRIIPNAHGAYTYDMTLGNGHRANGTQFANLIRRQSKKPAPPSMAWLPQQQHAMWGPNGGHPMWQNPAAVAPSPVPPTGLNLYTGNTNNGVTGHPYEMMLHSQSHEDITLFRACFIAFTDDGTLILSNIVDLGLDEETQERAVVNVSRKILFFHLET